MIGGIAAGIVVFNAEKERLENNIFMLCRNCLRLAKKSCI